MKGKKFLITKDRERSQNLEKLLQDHQCQLYFAPLFEVSYLENVIEKKDFGAVIVTSANAVSSLTKMHLDKKITVFSVGKITTLELENAGFSNVKTAPNQDAASLKELIIAKYKQDKELLYLCGDKITLDFQKELEVVNMKVQKYVSYQTTPKTEITPDIAAIKCDYILIFSKYSAQLFLELSAKNVELKANFKLAKILCLSNKIADEFQNSDFQNIGNFSELDVLKKYYL